MFMVCTFLASIAAGGGGIAVTTLTAPMTLTDTTAVVVNNADFLQNASVTYPAYFMIDDEIMCYTADPPDTTHFTSILRAQADPMLSPPVLSSPATHASGATVRTLAVGAMDSFMGTQITTSTAGFGLFQSLTFVGKMFTNLPKFLAWNYPFLGGQMVYFKYFVLYPLSAGFVVAFCFAMISVATGIIKSIV